MPRTKRVVGTALACLVECAASSLAAFPSIAARTAGAGAASGRRRALFAAPPAALWQRTGAHSTICRSSKRAGALPGGSLHVRCLNRLMFEREDVVPMGEGGARIVLGESDPRTKHVRKIIKTPDGSTLRVGVVDHGVEEDAVVCWGEDGSLELTVPVTNKVKLLPFPRPPSSVKPSLFSLWQPVRVITRASPSSPPAHPSFTLLPPEWLHLPSP